MISFYRNCIFLIIPFIIMVGINEIIRPKIKEIPYNHLGVTAINSANKLTHKCTWICHNNTKYCKANHVKFLKSHFYITDKLYFGVINLLGSTGNYGLANIVFLVVLIPISIWYFLSQSLNMYIKIKKIKNK